MRGSGEILRLGESEIHDLGGPTTSSIVRKRVSKGELEATARAVVDAALPGLLLPHFDALDAAMESLLDDPAFQGANAAERALRGKHLKRLRHHHHRDARARLAAGALPDESDEDEAEA